MGIVVFKLTLCVMIGLIVGNAVYKKYRKKRVYYEQIVNLIDNLESDLTFRQNKISVIIERLSSSFCLELSTNCDDFIKLINGKDSEFERFNFSTDEYSEIVAFFTSLGTSDLATQLSQLSRHKIKFLQRLDGAKCNEKRIGKPSVKLCFFLSLAVGIIIL